MTSRTADELSVPTPRKLDITIHRCFFSAVPGPSWKASWDPIKRKAPYFVKVLIDDRSKETRITRRDNWQLDWNEKFSFENVMSSNMTLELYRKNNIETQLSTAIPETQTGSTPISQIELFANGLLIEFSFSSIEADQHEIRDSETRDAVNQAIQALGSLHTPTDWWKNLLQSIQNFRAAVAAIAEVHPYARIAQAILFSIPNHLIDQIERDKHIQDLFTSLSSLCDIAIDPGYSEFIQSAGLQDVLKRASLQLTEVAYFVRDYCQRNLWKRTLKSIFSAIDDTIQEYKSKLEELRDEFRLRLALQTGEIVAQAETRAKRTETKVMCVFKKLKEIEQLIDLFDMTYVPGAGLNVDKICMYGTRQEILQEIEEWVNSYGSRTLLLSGGAGTGKSAIAHTIAKRFKDLGRLGSMFCFSEVEKAKRKAESLFPHIARDLADLDINIRAELYKAAQNKADRTTTSITAQFENLLLTPVNAIQDDLHGPIVIVIDALDDSGTAGERRGLLQLLTSRLKELPPNFRILITARPDPDIEQAFQSKSDIQIKRMNSIPLQSTTEDITTYVKRRLNDDPEVGSDMCQSIALHAHALFQWASVACEFILDRELGESALDRYEMIIPPTTVDGETEVVGDTLLDYLYLAVLSKAVASKSRAQMENFRFVMAQVLTAFEPLSCKSLNKLIAGSKSAPRNCNAEKVVTYLGSLLAGTDDQDTPIRPLHTSFRDFLTNPNRSGDFFIYTLDIACTHRDMTWASLSIMTEELRFNICQLDTSYLPNQDVPGIEGLIKQNISPHLSYACRFWSAHLYSLPTTNTVTPLQGHSYDWSELTDAVYQVLCVRLLYWLEVLSLQGTVDTGLRQIRKVRAWVKECGTHNTIVHLIEDIEIFCSYFAKCIATSAPHIYISALPFAPKDSLIAKKYIKSNNRTLSIVTGLLEQYPSCLNELRHTSPVISVAFSPDGTRIVSASKDDTIRIWNAENGEMILGPVQTPSITSVAFSPDGTRIASGSEDKSLSIRSAENGNVILGPLRGHTEPITSVIFSPEGERIVTCSSDNTIRVWSAKDGNMILGPLKGHTKPVAAVAFSPDGTCILSGSLDCSIRIWNAKNGEAILGPLEGHTLPVNSVAFSPDGTRVVSSSDDKTICVWSAKSGEIILRPLQQHTLSITAISYSPDGTRIVSCSADRTIRIWNAQNGEAIPGLLEGHTDSVTTMALSQDGTRIVSGSWDKTIRVWNLENAGTATGLSQGRAWPINSISVSPDGSRIVSGSGDRSIRVWDAENGQIVLGPLWGHTDPVSSVAFSPDGLWIASGAVDQTIIVWSVENGEIVLGPLKDHEGSVNSVVFSPDGAYIVSGSFDGTIRKWDARSGETVLEPFEGHTGSVNSVTFSSNGFWLASGSDDLTILVWNADTGETIVGPIIGHEQPISSVAFSPDNTQIVSGSWDDTIRVWNSENGKLILGPLTGHEDGVTSVAFSPNGLYIISSSHDRTIRVWNARNGKAVAGPLDGRSDSIGGALFSPDGTRIISGSYDAMIEVHRFTETNSHVIAASELSSNDITITGNQPNLPPALDAPNDSSMQQTVPQHCWHVEDGWSRGPNGELLFYVPPFHRPALCEPCTILATGGYHVMLDMSRFVHGSRWTESFDVTS